MQLNENVLKRGENAIFQLRSLYQKYGYTQFKMSKFEEYDLYVRNKDFLISDSIITFNDTNGKLMALKPDVTLSIIKNSQGSSCATQKVYYNESVYRISGSTHSFSEIMQTGLECIGDIDNYKVCEVVLLAAKSLHTICPDFIMDLSHMGLISTVLDGCNIEEDVKAQVIHYLGEKNLHDIKSLLSQYDVPEETLYKISSLINIYGKIEDVLVPLSEVFSDEDSRPAILELKNLCAVLQAEGFQDKINIDFSIVNDMNYYSGVVFKGYINGIPSSVLSGGQYDNLMYKMGRHCGAIGFAVYLDLLERLQARDRKYDIDTVILYDENADPAALSKAIKMLTDTDACVLAEKNIPENIKYRQLLKFKDRGFEIIENND